MKTYTTITSIVGITERKHYFIRSGSAKHPTYDGAARMVAAKLNREDDSGGPPVRPSDVTISRVEMCGYVSR